MSPYFAADGLRTTSASANLKDVPSNIHIWTDTTVNKVIFEGTHAVGVEAVDGRKGKASPALFRTYQANL